MEAKCKEEIRNRYTYNGDFDLREFRRDRPGLQQMDIVHLVHSRYPKFTKQMESSAENPDYGVKLRRAAENMVIEQFGKIKSPSDLPRKPEKRRNRERVFFRINENQRERLELAMRRDGFDTYQALGQHLIESYINSEKQEKIHVDYTK